MKTLNLNLPEGYEEFKIVAISDKDCPALQETGKKLFNLLLKEVPQGIYPILEEEIIIRYFEKAFDFDQLEEFKKLIESEKKIYFKGMYLHKNILEAIKRKEIQESAEEGLLSYLP
jgi:hypothetical protein